MEVCSNIGLAWSGLASIPSGAVLDQRFKNMFLCNCFFSGFWFRHLNQLVICLLVAGAIPYLGGRSLSRNMLCIIFMVKHFKLIFATIQNLAWLGPCRGLEMGNIFRGFWLLKLFVASGDYKTFVIFFDFEQFCFSLCFLFGNKCF